MNHIYLLLVGFQVYPHPLSSAFYFQCNFMIGLDEHLDAVQIQKCLETSFSDWWCFILKPHARCFYGVNTRSFIYEVSIPRFYF